VTAAAFTYVPPGDSGDRTLSIVRAAWRGRGPKPNALLATYDDDGRFVSFVAVKYRPESEPAIVEVRS